MDENKIDSVSEDAEDKEIDEVIDDLFDDILTREVIDEAPVSKEETSAPDKPSIKAAPRKKTLNKKMTPPEPRASKKKTKTSKTPDIKKKEPAQDKQNPPVTEKKNLSEDSKKAALNSTAQKTPLEVKTAFREKRIKRRPLLIILSLLIVAVLPMLVIKMMKHEGSGSSSIEPVVITRKIEKEAKVSQVTKMPPAIPAPEDTVESETKEPDIPVLDTIKGEEKIEENTVSIDMENIADRASNITKEDFISYPYSVYLGSYSSLEKVKQAASDNTSGLIPYWIKIDLGEKGIWYRLFEGFFQTREEADGVIKTRNIREAESRLTKYANLIGVYKSKEDAHRQKNILDELEHCSYIISDSEDTYRLYTGGFYQKARAEEQKNNLELDGIKSQTVER